MIKNNKPEPDYDPRTKYNWREFHPPASDKLGHGTLLRVQVPTNVAAQLSVVVNSQRFPYEGVAQLIRHAILRHLDWLEELEEIPSVLGAIKAMNDAMVEEECQIAMENLIERTRAIVDRNYRESDPRANGENVRFLSDILEHISAMPEGYHKDKCLRRFNDQFKAAVDSCERVPLSRLGEEE